MSSGDASPVARARRLLAAEQPDRAMAELAPYLAANPTDAEALCLASSASSDLGHAGTARSLAERAVAARPDDDWPLRLLAYAYSGLGMPAQAVAAARSAIALAPDSALTHAVMVDVAGHLPQYRRVALESASRVTAMAPDSPRPTLRSLESRWRPTTSTWPSGPGARCSAWTRTTPTR